MLYAVTCVTANSFKRAPVSSARSFWNLKVQQRG